MAVLEGTRKKKRELSRDSLTPFLFTCADSIVSAKRTRAARPEVSDQPGKLLKNSAKILSFSLSDNLIGLMALAAKYPKIIAVPMMMIRSEPNFSIISVPSSTDTIHPSPKFDYANR